MVWFSKIQDSINKLWERISGNFDEKVSDVHSTIKNINTLVSDSKDILNDRLGNFILLDNPSYTYDNTATTVAANKLIWSKTLPTWGSNDWPFNAGILTVVFWHSASAVIKVDDDNLITAEINNGNAVPGNTLYQFSMPVHGGGDTVDIYVDVPASTNYEWMGAIYLRKF